MRIKVSTSLLTTLVLLSGSAAAQQQLVGFTANRTTPSSNITGQRLCDPPVTVCGNALPAPGAEHAGGAANSPFRSSVWHTQGTRLQELIIDTCQPTCSTAAFLSLGPNSLATGLTINNRRREMYQSESIPGWAGIVTYRLAMAPCPQVITECRFQLPSQQHLAGALTYDGERDVIYVAASIFTPGAAPNNFLLLFRRSDPSCQPFCRVPVDNCGQGPLGPIRALAYDECKDTIYVSDGRQTSEQRVFWSAGCVTLRQARCCVLNHPQGELWYGFDLRSTRARTVGFSCMPTQCIQCPSMALNAVGTPAIGNGSFAVRVENAPSGAAVWLALNVGACTPGLPYSCGRFYPALSPAPIIVGPLVAGGVGGCTGTADFPLPIPGNYGACGLQLCTQALVLCPSGAGVGLTNALELTLSP